MAKTVSLPLHSPSVFDRLMSFLDEVARLAARNGDGNYFGL
jgi:hypothetical protein